MRSRKQWLVLSGLVFVVSLLICLILVFAPARVGEFQAEAGIRFRDGKMRLKERFFPAKIDPSDLWYAAFQLVLEGEAARDKGHRLEAIRKFTDSKARFDKLARSHPHFYPDLVRFRREQLRDSLRDLRSNPKASHPVILPAWEPFEDSVLIRDPADP